MGDTVIGILLLVILLATVFILGIYNRSKAQKEPQKFTYDKAEWQWDSVEEDYCRTNNIVKENLTAEDKDVIYEYCGMHIAYFLNWAIRNDFVSRGQRKEKDLLEKIKEGKENACEFLKKIDFKLCREDFKEDILGFVDSYYQTQYFEDYVEITGLGNDKWCENFDYEKYYKLEDRINERFEKYQKLSR